MSDLERDVDAYEDSCMKWENDYNAARDRLAAVLADVWKLRALEKMRAQLSVALDEKQEQRARAEQAEAQSRECMSDHEDLSVEVNDLRVRLWEAERERDKWKRIRTPTHGSCCTCQACGLDYDSCRCDLDDVADRLAAVLADVRAVIDAFEAGLFVRSTEGDERSDWAIKFALPLSSIARLRAHIDATEGESDA